MQTLLRHRKPIALSMLALAVFFSAPIRPAMAALVETDAVSAPDVAGARDALVGFIEREDVCRELRILGVDPVEARARIKALNDAEVKDLAARLPELPAGGMSGIGPPWYFIFIPLFIVAIVLAILGYLGYWAHQKSEKARIAEGKPPLDPAGSRGAQTSVYPPSATRTENFALNPSEPWTGKWKVTSSRLIGNWVLQQYGNRIISERESDYRLEATVSGNTIKGTWSEPPGRYGGPFSAVLSEDGLSFSAQAGSHYFKGVKVE